jgi:tripartite-type tricarboxylate transporter receptor subunit TctC
MTRWLRAAGCAVLWGWLSTASAQAADWPARAVRIVVPAPAGGPFDRTIRPVAKELAAAWGQPVIVDNRPSAGNIVGTHEGAQAAPDGYTLTMTGMVNTITAGLHDKLPFDIVDGFVHIGAIGEAAQWLVVRSDAPYTSLADLIAAATRAPGRIDYASSGAGSTGHLVMELLQRAAGVRFTHVPYKGGAPALQDVLAGVVGVLVIPQNAAEPLVRAGKLKALTVTSAQRSPAAPGVPTFAELGHPRLTVTSWVGLSAPKGTPPAVVRRIHASLQAVLAQPELVAQLESQGLTIAHGTPEQYTQLVRDDTERWGTLVRSLKLKAE